MGFRGQILNYIYNQLCTKLIISEPNKSYQNSISGYEDLNWLQQSDNRIVAPTPGTDADKPYLAPRQSKLPEFNTPLRMLYNRPITQNDVAGLRIDPITKLPEIMTPSAFIHIVTAEKDLYFPSRRIPAEGRLNDQIEFLKIGIDCVLRDETVAIPGTNFGGNGKYWHDQIKLCQVPEPPNIDNIPSLQSITNYIVPYHKPINQQATGFVEDTERILCAGTLRNMVFKYGPNEESEAKVMNIILGIWGMLPDSENSPTDTVRCIFELEIHYPKVPGLC